MHPTMSRGVPGLQAIGGNKGINSHSEPQRELISPSPWFHTSSLQNCEKIDFFCSNSPGLWDVVMATRGNKYTALDGTIFYKRSKFLIFVTSQWLSQLKHSQGQGLGWGVGGLAGPPASRGNQSPVPARADPNGRCLLKRWAPLAMPDCVTVVLLESLMWNLWMVLWSWLPRWR